MSAKIQVWAFSKKNANNDELIKQTANAESFGSGYGFGYRDISFYADNNCHASLMRDKLLKLRGVVKIEIVYPDKNIRYTFEKKSGRVKYYKHKI